MGKATTLILLCIGCIILGTVEVLTTYEYLSCVLFLGLLSHFVESVGKKLCVVEFTALLATLTWLVVPIFFYHFFNEQNYYASLWVKYMSSDSDSYYSYMLPATICYSVGLFMPIISQIKKINPKHLVHSISLEVSTKPYIPISLLLIGISASVLIEIVPSEFRYVFFQLSQLTYIGGLYALFSYKNMSKIQVYLALSILLGKAIVSGMFGDVMYFIILSTFVYLYGKNINSLYKYLSIILGFIFITLIQSVKLEYREVTWKSGKGDALLLVDLLSERITDPVTLFNEYKLFSVAVRLNQGWLISEIISNVPSKFPYANGGTIINTIEAILMPRILNPDKRASGGEANVERFLGWKNKHVSMNIGAVGEGYGNFGRIGGMIFIFFYGLFLNLALQYTILKSIKRPTLILWVPFLFFYSVVVETDMLTTYNSLFKSFIFMLLFFPLYKSLFKQRL